MLEEFFKDPRFFLNVLESMRDGLMVVDAGGNIVYLNKAAEEITGLKRDVAAGQPCTVLDTDTCVVLTEDGVQRKCDLFKNGVVCNKRCRIRARDGRAVYLLKNAVVLRGQDEEIIGAVETMTDITSLYMKELELEEIKRELRQEYWFMGLLGKGVWMKRLYEQIRDAAGSEAPVLIYGESGTGKDLVANAIHKLSRRKDGPFIKMNCAALNEQLMESELFGHKKGSFTGAINDRTGRFEASDKGSIFLDEVGDMPPAMQAKLLRVLEEKVVERVGEHRPVPVDIRLISATNKDLNDLVALGKFREDLLYRVNSIVIRTPPLRERKEDIPALIAHYLMKISAVNNKKVEAIDPQAMEMLENYFWPGNVRQLINALEHCAVTCKGGTVRVADLPDYINHGARPGNGGAASDRDSLLGVLAQHGGNKTRAAKSLGISRVTLWKKLKELGVE